MSTLRKHCKLSSFKNSPGSLCATASSASSSRSQVDVYLPAELDKTGSERNSLLVEYKRSPRHCIIMFKLLFNVPGKKRNNEVYAGQLPSALLLKTDVYKQWIRWCRLLFLLCLNQPHLLSSVNWFLSALAAFDSSLPAQAGIQTRARKTDPWTRWASVASLSLSLSHLLYPPVKEVFNTFYCVRSKEIKKNNNTIIQDQKTINPSKST